MTNDLPAARRGLRLAARVVAAAAAALAAASAFAQTVDYRCVDGRALRVHYAFGEATAHARLVLGGRTHRLRHDAASDRETTVFRRGALRLSVDNRPDVRQAGNLFVTRTTSTRLDGKPTQVDRVLYKSCEPTPASRRRPVPPVDPSTGEPLRAGVTAYGDAFRVVVDATRLRLESPKLVGDWAYARSAWARGAEYTAEAARPPISLTVRNGACRGSDGRAVTMRAQLRIGDRVLRGCAVPGAWGTAPT